MSDLEADLPSEATISQKLRDIVIALHKAGNPDELTVKRVRTRAETELGLPTGHLKNGEWKQKSQSAIVDAVDKYVNKEPAPEPKLAPTKKAPTRKAPKAKPAESKPAVKRKAAATKKPQKRRKTASSDDESEAELSDALSEELSDLEDESPKKHNRRCAKVVAEDSDDEPAPSRTTKQPKIVTEDDESDDVVPKPARRPKTPPTETKGDISESELSSLIDESPARKRQKKEPGAKSKKEPTKARARAANPKEKDNPDQAEIKRLQGWLVKCGIRKVWSKELANCDSSKDKIKHLRTMLSDAGMDGKYSIEKAAKIKEKREFEKDLAAIKEGERSWGKAPEQTSGRPTRRAASRAAPVQKVVFSDDDEDEVEEKDQEESSDDDQDDDDVEGESQDDERINSAGDDSE